LKILVELLEDVGVSFLLNFGTPHLISLHKLNGTNSFWRFVNEERP
jgi:hypothetical protein